MGVLFEIKYSITKQILPLLIGKEHNDEALRAESTHKCAKNDI
jgi:hypothetical protein